MCETTHTLCLVSDGTSWRGSFPRAVSAVVHDVTDGGPVDATVDIHADRPGAVTHKDVRIVDATDTALTLADATTIDLESILAIHIR